MNHIIDESDLLNWLSDERWETYAPSKGNRLVVETGSRIFEVFIAGARVYRGGDPKLAVKAYNSALPATRDMEASNG
jgi:hypothetical protein